MSRFDVAFGAAVEDFAARGLLRQARVYPDALLDFSSNDYLGLRTHPVLRGRSAAWAERFGAGSGASRLVNGTSALHLAVEAKLAALKGTEAALLFASGWQANASVLSSLLRFGKPARVFCDELIHASLHHACRAAGVDCSFFRHNDLGQLSDLLRASQGMAGMRFIVTETVFSMDGDQADVCALAALADRFGAFLYLDEAHATGMLGPRGMGLSGLAPGGVDLVMGTFSKALGGFGAYVAGSRAVCGWLVNRASGFVHSTALPPAVLGAMDAALDLVPGMAAERAHGAALAARLRAGLTRVGVPVGGSTTQIVPVMLGDAGATLDAAERLREAGVLAIGIRPPTVPPGTSRIRLAVSAAHSEADVDRVVDAVSGLRMAA